MIFLLQSENLREEKHNTCHFFYRNDASSFENSIRFFGDLCAVSVDNRQRMYKTSLVIVISGRLSFVVSFFQLKKGSEV